jgi:hypothetical protein
MLQTFDAKLTICDLFFWLNLIQDFNIQFTYFPFYCDIETVRVDVTLGTNRIFLFFKLVKFDFCDSLI